MGIAETLESPAAEKSQALVRELVEEVAEHAGNMVNRYARPAGDTSEKTDKKGFAR